MKRIKWTPILVLGGGIALALALTKNRASMGSKLGEFNIHIDWPNIIALAEAQGITPVDLLVSWYGEYWRSDFINLYNAYLQGQGDGDHTGTLSVQARIGTTLVAGVPVYVDGQYQGVSTSITAQTEGSHFVVLGEFTKDGILYKAAGSQSVNIVEGQVTYIVIDMQRTSGGVQVKYRLNVTTPHNGEIVYDPYSADNTFLEGVTVTIEAIAKDGYRFNKWIIDGEEEYGYRVFLFMDKNHAVFVEFVAVEVEPPIEPPKPKTNWTLPIVIGGAALGVVAIATRRRKKNV